MDDAGQTGAAAAMAVMIMMAAAIAKIVQMTLGKLLENRTQACEKLDECEPVVMDYRGMAEPQQRLQHLLSGSVDDE